MLICRLVRKRIKRKEFFPPGQTVDSYKDALEKGYSLEIRRFREMDILS